MIREKLYRRLERLEEEMMPPGPPTILHIVPINPDGTQAPGGFTFEIPSYRPAQDYWRGAAGPRTLSRRR
jgi:hypothetical protein